jgi:hypothetical protein
MPLGKLVHKGYSLRLLVAHYRTTSSLHATFKFRELFGKPPLSAKSALTSPTSCCRSVGIVRSRTQATEFVFFCLLEPHIVLLLTKCASQPYFSNIFNLRCSLKVRDNFLQSYAKQEVTRNTRLVYLFISILSYEYV